MTWRLTRAARASARHPGVQAGSLPLRPHPAPARRRAGHRARLRHLEPRQRREVPPASRCPSHLPVTRETKPAQEQACWRSCATTRSISWSSRATCRCSADFLTALRARDQHHHGFLPPSSASDLSPRLDRGVKRSAHRQYVTADLDAAHQRASASASHADEIDDISATAATSSAASCVGRPPPRVSRPRYDKNRRLLTP